MDLCTNAGIASAAMKYVTQKTEQLDTLQMLYKSIEAVEEERVEEEQLQTVSSNYTNES